MTSYWAGGQTGFDGIDTRLTTPFDFPMYAAMVDVVAHGDSAKKLVDVLRQDRFYPHPELLVTFIGNHDKPRFLTEAGGSIEKLKLGFSLLATTRGIPQLYYGDEVAMAGGDDPDDRHDFPGGFPGDANNAFSKDSRTQEQQDVFAHVQKLLQLRRDNVALRTGVQKHVAVGDKYYVFTREANGERLLIAFHNAESIDSLGLDLAGTAIADARDTRASLRACISSIEGRTARVTVASTQLDYLSRSLRCDLIRVSLAFCDERIAGARLEHNVSATPGLIVDESPLVAAADVVFGNQHVARPNNELFSITRGEFESPRQRDHVLPLGGIVPVERGVRRRFLEMDRCHIGGVVLGNCAFNEMRSVIGSGVELESMEHDVSP